MEDLSDLILYCRIELHRIGETWRSSRTLDFCEKATGKRDAHYLTEEHLRQLLTKIQSLPTVSTEIRIGARVRAFDQQGIVKEWDADIECWLVKMSGKLEPFTTEELELIS